MVDDAQPDAAQPSDAETRRAYDELRDDELVLEFVKGRNVRCPICAYNLRDAVEPRCTECGSALRLSLYGSMTRRPWSYSFALFALVFAMIVNALLILVGLTPLRVPALAIGGTMFLASFVLIWLLETRFWTYWARFTEHRRLLLAICWLPLAAAACVLAAIFVFSI